MSRLWQVASYLSTALLLLTVWQLQRRSYFRSYPWFSGYILAQLLMTVAVMAQQAQFFSVSSEEYVRLYWSTEFVTQALLTAVMASFIYRALEGVPERRKTLLLVAVVLVVSAAATVFGTGPGGLGSPRWTSSLVRNLSFGAALLNVVLWRALLKNRSWDVQLCLLSLGVGMMTTGRAIGQSLRLLGAQGAGNGFVVLTELLCLAVWFLALQRFKPAERAVTAASA